MIEALKCLWRKVFFTLQQIGTLPTTHFWSVSQIACEAARAVAAEDDAVKSWSELQDATIDSWLPTHRSKYLGGPDGGREGGSHSVPTSKAFGYFRDGLGKQRSSKKPNRRGQAESRCGGYDRDVLALARHGEAKAAHGPELRRTDAMVRV
jgi:hypothetical protein